MAEEYLYHVDENNKVLGKITKQEAIKRKVLHRGVDIFVMNSKGEILITRRTDTKLVYPGRLELDQGGGVTFGESWEEAAKREIEEEAGIQNPELEYLFEFKHEDVIAPSFCRAYLYRYDGPITPQEEEIQDYFFASIEKIEELIKKNPEDICPGTIVTFRMFVKHLKRQGKIE